MNKKKVIFCTYSSIYSSIVLKHLLEDDKIEIVAIVNSTRIFRSDYGFIQGSIKQILTTGWRYSAYLFLITDFFSWLQAIFPFNENKLKTVHGLARRYQIPILDTRDINHDDSVKFIRQFQASYLVAAHFNQLIKEDILNFSNLSCLNIHPSLLPHYKGVDPVFFALFDTQEKVGVSLHKMSESFDTGEVLLQNELLLKSSTNVFSINCQLFSTGGLLICQWLNDKRKQQNNVSIPNKSKQNQYDSWPSAKTVKQFKKSGKCLIQLREYFSYIRS